MTEETKTQTIEWGVVRLNYAEPFEHFLTKSLKPFVNSLIQAGIVERYFWQRGYDKGAHILLCMRAEIRTLNELVLPSLNEHFNHYVEDLPSLRPFENPNFEPNDSLQTAVYQPNMEEWGGIIGMPIIERFQQTSSEAVLSFMAAKASKWSPVEALATAIELHLGFADASGMKKDEAIQFFDFCLMRHVKEPFSLQLFEYIFKKQEKPLVEFTEKLWTSLKRGTLFKERYYNQYLEHSYYTSEDLKLTFRKRSLDVEPTFSSIWVLFAKLFDDTNKRLGLQGRHELLLYYAILRSLEKVNVVEKY
jgi:Lantibiotic biosynthesis dehydratase C-term